MGVEYILLPGLLSLCFWKDSAMFNLWVDIRECPCLLAMSIKPGNLSLVFVYMFT